MCTRRRWLALPLLGGLALVVGLALPATSRADGKKPPRPAPQKGGKPAPGPNAKVHFEEAQLLRQAFGALAGANHDYNGHRWQALLAVKRALRALDGFVLRHGAGALKAATRNGQAAVAQAERAAGSIRMFHEPQPASDAALRQAYALLGEVRGPLVQNKQRGVLGDVNTALREIRIALKIR